MSANRAEARIVTSRPNPKLTVHARAKLPTRNGDFEIVSFVDAEGQRIDDVAVIVAPVAGVEELPVRVHSECLTGDVFGSKRCDCRDQLEIALERVTQNGAGAVLYMRQEGRGIGIAEKVKAYSLQEQGLDTLDANIHLGFDGDLRDYSLAAAMLEALEVASIVLFTNNPLKVEGLEQHGVRVARRESIVADSRDENVAYLDAKRRRMGHLL
jgi:GTP cyclohydrolase II